MKFWTRTVSLALTLSIAASLAACGQPASGSASSAGSAPSSSSSGVSGEETGPYIEIPAEYQSWDESGQKVTRDMLATGENGMVATLN